MGAASMDAFFKVLGLPPNSSYEDVRDAYKTVRHVISQVRAESFQM